MELTKAKTTWVLFVDSDEKISQNLKKEILEVIQSSEYDAYYVPRLDIFMGRELRHGETGHARFVRLAKKDFGRWIRPVHETWIPSSKNKEIGTLQHPLIHESHPTISSFLEKINNYSTIDADYRFKQGVKSSLWQIWVYPMAKFIYNYFFKLGILDGTPGTIMAIMMSFHSYLTWTKLYLLWHKK